jgi:hypothetical protein
VQGAEFKQERFETLGQVFKAIKDRHLTPRQMRRGQVRLYKRTNQYLPLPETLDRLEQPKLAPSFED